MLSKAQKRTVLGAAIMVVAVVFFVPYIRIHQYKDRIAAALSQAVGRSVTVQDVSIQTFPQPGLLLSGVVVADDPTISAEPMLRADEPVLATLHVSSLWRGRLEISSLKLSYPSINLVRAKDGRWNIESLLERARQTPTAPTSKKAPESRTRFPYIEAKGARINLKSGQEKKVFALGEAEFAFWLASEDEWRMRLEARPIRTDQNLSDTGTIKLEGAWHRAAQLKETPLSFRFWWENGQLGQMTMLVYGRDRGLRGTTEANATVEGTPENLSATVDLRIEDFRRYDITTRDSLTAQIHCAASLSVTATYARNIDCTSPMGSGVLQAHGGVDWSHPSPAMQLSFAGENVPLQYLASVARHLKKDVPEDINVSGMASGSVTMHTDESGSRLWAGNGQTSRVEVRSSVLSETMTITPTRWRMIGPGSEQFQPRKAGKKAKPPADMMPAPNVTALSVDPIVLDLGGSSPASLSAWFSREGFSAQLSGDAQVEKLIQTARLIGLPSLGTEVTGTAKGKLEVAGKWSGFAQPVYTANAQLQKVVAKLNGVASPVTIQSATFQADNKEASLSNAIASFAGVHSSFEFSVHAPRGCTPDEDQCRVTFDVKADEVNVDEINSLLNPKAQKQPWYASIANTVMGAKAKSLPDIFASGKVTTGKLIFKDVTATKFTAGLTIDPTRFVISNASADVLGGKFTGELSGDYHGGEPVYSSQGKLQNVALANVGTLMKDGWGSGKINLTYSGQAAGSNAEELRQSAAGSADFDWHDGMLHHIVLDQAGKPLQFRSFAGKLELKDGALVISQSKLQAPKGIYLVSGTASLGRDLDLKLARDGATTYSVSGTLQNPVVAR